MALHHLLAYVGAGPGLTMLWAFIALFGTICLSVLYLLSWPLRLLIRRGRGSAGASIDGQNSAPPKGNPDESTNTSEKRE